MGCQDYYHQIMPFLLITAIPLIYANDDNVFDENEPLSSTELRQLQDFVRNQRGKGSISRLSGADPLDLPDIDLSSDQQQQNQAGDEPTEIGKPPFQAFQVVMPSKVGAAGPKKHQSSSTSPDISSNSNTTTTSTPTTERRIQISNWRQKPAEKIEQPVEQREEDYERLAKLLKRFLNRHKTVTTTEEVIPNTKTTVEPTHLHKDDGLKNKNGATSWSESREQVIEDIDTEEYTNVLPKKKSNNLARGKILGTLPVSVELGQEGIENDQIRKEKEDKRTTTTTTSRSTTSTTTATTKSLSVLESNRNNNNNNRNLINKVITEQNGRRRENNNRNNISWVGSVEKVQTLTMTNGIGTGSVRPITPSPVRPHILGRVVVQPSRNPATVAETNNEFFYEIQKSGENSAAAVEETTTKKKTLLNAKNNITTKPQINVLREGLARQSNSEYVFVASITMIRDGEKVILVDTGLGTDINGRTDLIMKLSRHEIAPPAVDYVVTTHGHPDHAGNTNDFPDAVHFQGSMSHYRTKFNFTDLFETDRLQLTPNVALIRTPGHTSEDISVLVQNVDPYGTVVVAGDVFISFEDLERPMMWRPLAWNETAQEEARKLVLCLADHVVPGHGHMFKVDARIRKQAGCAAD